VADTCDAGYVDDRRLKRSASNAAGDVFDISHSGKNGVSGKTRPPIAKPVRRSKSQAANGAGLVTNIRHGGPVTLVSVGADEPDVPTASTSALEGPHTLPRSEARRSKKG